MRVGPTSMKQIPIQTTYTKLNRALASGNDMTSNYTDSVFKFAALIMGLSVVHVPWFTGEHYSQGEH